MSCVVHSYSYTIISNMTGVTCATAQYITHVKEEQAYTGAVGNKNIRLYKTTTVMNLVVTSSQRHSHHPPTCPQLHGDSGCNWMVLEVHCGLICILFPSQSFGIISQSITSRSNYDCGFFTVQFVRVPFSMGVHIHVVNKAAQTQSTNRSAISYSFIKLLPNTWWIQG